MRKELVLRVREEFGNRSVTHDDLKALRERGMTMGEIALALGVTRQDIRFAEQDPAERLGQFPVARVYDPLGFLDPWGPSPAIVE